MNVGKVERQQKIVAVHQHHADQGTERGNAKVFTRKEGEIDQWGTKAPLPTIKTEK